MRTPRVFAVILTVVTFIGSTSVFAATETEYLAVFMDGKKIGHAKQTRIVEDGKVTTSEEISMTISRSGIPMSVNTLEKTVETTDGKPIRFESVMDLSLMKMKFAGVVEDGKANITAEQMGQKQNLTIDWPEGALMAEGLRQLAMKKGLEEGTEYTAKVFLPSQMDAMQVNIAIGAKQQVDLLGRVLELTKVTTSYSMGHQGKLTTVSYYDDDYRLHKSATPLMGMTIEMVGCTKEFALSKNDPVELIDKMFIASPRPLKNLDKISSATYTLAPLEGAKLTILSGDNQTVRKLDNGRIELTVKPVKAKSGAKIPYKGDDRLALEALKPSLYVQSDHPEIIALARRAVGKTTDAAEAAKKIEQFVADYMTNAGLSVGYATAAEVLESKQGDCSEFAVLTAALCRAGGIPAQVVTGIAYVDHYAGYRDNFGGHAWVRAYINGKWVGLDAAFKSSGRGGYDAGHIALAAGNGDPAGFFDLATTMGRFKIVEIKTQE